MDLITSYSSDDSDVETINKKETESTGTDFFNLKENDDEVENTINDNNRDLLCEAANLSDTSYGPTFPSNAQIISYEQEYLANDELKPRKRSGNTVPDFIRKMQRCDSFYNSNTKNIVGNLKINISKTCMEDISKVNCKGDNSKIQEETDHNKDNIEIQSFEETVSEEKDNRFEILFHSPNNPYYQISGEGKNYIPKREIQSFQSHTSMVTSLAWNFSQYSHLMLTSSLDSTLKVWNMFSGTPKCVKVYCADAGIKISKWSLCGTKVLWGGYDKQTSILDICTGKVLSSIPIHDYVSSIDIHPELPYLFLVGTRDDIYAFDQRSSDSDPIKYFHSKCQYVLDLAFMKNGTEFISSSDGVSRDSGDKTIMVWDFASGAILSNQIFCERYTCPCIRVAPDEKHFVAQTNGNYIALFSTKRPYKLKEVKFTGHKVLGYSIGCDFSPDSRFIVSGDMKGCLYFYNYYNCHRIKRIETNHKDPTVRVAWHPLLNSTIATAFLDGLIQIWQ